MTTDYLLDGDTVVQEGHAVNGTFTSTATYFNGMYRRDDVAGTLRWYVMDGLGSVVGEVDPSGNLTCSRGFDVYGATGTLTGTLTSKHGFVGKLGHETEDISGLVYMRARWYDASVGRFVCEDPGRDGGNWYIYASDAPADGVDSDGRKMEAGPGGWLALALTAMLDQMLEHMKENGDIDPNVDKFLRMIAEIVGGSITFYKGSEQVFSEEMKGVEVGLVGTCEGLVHMLGGGVDCVCGVEKFVELLQVLEGAQVSAAMNSGNSGG